MPDIAPVAAPSHYPDNVGAQTIKTAPFLLAERVLGEVIAMRAMAAFVGIAGTGKTFALRTLVGGLEADVAWLEFQSRPSQLDVTQDLFRVLIGEVPDTKRSRLSQLLLEYLSQLSRELIIVVDEAQRLSTLGIEVIRYLHDHPSTDFALVLSGGDGCWAVISGEPMLRSRVYRRVRFQPLAPPEVLTCMRNYHEVYVRCPDDLILEIDRDCCHGIFRHWSAFTATVVPLMGRRKTLTAEIARKAMRLIPSGD